MKITIIGGTGHIGTFLCPMLASEGHEVICVSRGANNLYHKIESAEKVRMLHLDRNVMANDEFARQIASLESDVVIDLINFKIGNAKAMVEALRGKVWQYIYYSSC
ncbi:NAD-dependent epimerase/dehydratase family protein [Bacteroides finegoldii]|uniref:NAD-dependent epimerase/dehydratase family protein n=1 Tax=Bacteroides finegoldii TaxID=338188 RepID=UPI00189CEEA8|nr:NAD-dependent epimerase/dehydratase family protein [Bacteroides finegoldii]